MGELRYAPVFMDALLVLDSDYGGRFVFAPEPVSGSESEYEAVRAWCRSSLTGHWGEYVPGVFFLCNERDAFAFKMRWV